MAADTSLIDPEALAARTLAVEQSAARASRDRVLAEQKAAEAAEAARLAAEAARLAAEAEAVRLAEEARVAAEAADAAEAAAEAARPKYARPGVGRLTSSFGNRWGRLHAGIDLAAGTGSPIRAAAAGTVVSARNEGGYGKCVRIQHADGTVTVYAHLSAFLVSAGEKVGPGEQIAREGNTGHSTGPHLHFEVRVGGAPVNPAKWLSARGVL
jgi:murein DD-endopeptidase MepM/ murein hydrolase activator NlpD